MFKIQSLFFLLLLFFCNTVCGQFVGLYPGDQPIEYKDKTLIVVVDNNNENAAEIRPELEKIMKENWKLTPYKIISLDELETYRQQPVGYIYISMELRKVKATVGGGLVYGKELTRFTLLGPSITKGGYVRGNAIYISTRMQEFTLHAGLLKDIKNLQGFLLKGSTDGANVPDISIKAKTIYVNQLQMGKRGEHDIRDKYPYKFKLVSAEEYSKALEKANPYDVFFDYTDSQQGGKLMVYSMDGNGSILWLQKATGVNNYVHVNFGILAKKLDKQEE